jgi:hypothetical protein
MVEALAEVLEDMCGGQHVTRTSLELAHLVLTNMAEPSKEPEVAPLKEMAPVKEVASLQAPLQGLRIAAASFVPRAAAPSFAPAPAVPASAPAASQPAEAPSDCQWAGEEWDGWRGQEGEAAWSSSQLAGLPQLPAQEATELLLMWFGDYSKVALGELYEAMGQVRRAEVERSRCAQLGSAA